MNICCNFEVGTLYTLRDIKHLMIQVLFLNSISLSDIILSSNYCIFIKYMGIENNLFIKKST